VLGATALRKQREKIIPGTSTEKGNRRSAVKEKRRKAKDRGRTTTSRETTTKNRIDPQPCLIYRRGEKSVEKTEKVVGTSNNPSPDVRKGFASSRQGKINGRPPFMVSGKLDSSGQA